MGSVIEYSGLITKIHAMEGNLLKLSQYEELLSQHGFRGAIDYLCATPGYAEAFADTAGSELHREAVERRLMESLYSDYMKLYRFSSKKTKEFLEMYFCHFEINLIKQCLRNVRNLASPDVTLGAFEDFFRRHSRLDLDGMNHSDTIAEFMPSVASSRYDKILRPIFNSGSENLYDYEIALDLYYFSTVWRIKDMACRSREQDIISKTMGTKIDLLNLSWIHRSRKHFHMEPEYILPMLIPIRHKLRKSDIDALVHAETDEAELIAFNNTKYAKYFEQSDLSDMSAVIDELLAHIYKLQSRKEPYSMAPVMKYLYFKEEEINHLVTLLEGIRYSRSKASLEKFIPAFVRNSGNTPGGDS